MDDAKLDSLLNRKRPTSVKPPVNLDAFYGEYPVGPGQMVTFKVQTSSGTHVLDARRHHSFNYGYMLLCNWIKQGEEEKIVVSFTAGNDIELFGRGLETIHRHLVSKSLEWIRSARVGEFDDRTAATFVRGISVKSSRPVAQASPAKPAQK